MKHPILNLALLSILAGPVLAQDDSDYDAFGIVDDNIPLEELVPLDDTMPPPLPLAEDGAADAATQVPAAPETPAAPAVAEPVEPEAPAVPRIASVAAPADWQAHEIHGFTFSAPPDWAVVLDEEDSLILFGGDRESRTGPSFAVMFDRNGLSDSDKAEILSQSDIMLADGTPFQRYEIRATMDGDVTLNNVTLLSPEKNRDGDYTIIALGVYNDDYEPHRETLESILASLKAPEAVPFERPEALNGLVSYDLPDSWYIHESADRMYLSVRPQGYPGYLSIATAHWVNKEQGLDFDVPDTASAPQDAEIFGQEAVLRAWPGASDEFLVGARAVPGRFEYYRLKSCLPGGEPIGILIAGSQEFHDGEDLKLALSSVTLTLPDGMQDCAAPAAQPSPVAQPPAMAAQGTTIDVQGVQFTLPQGWSVLNDSPSDKMFTSPDGRFTILAFWWFPDEPLTGLDDIAVKQVVNDHEPSTRITTRTGSLVSIMNVTERARADEKRFIFTLEGSDVSLDELSALHATLIPGLRFGTVFDPDGNRPAAQQATPPVPAVTEQPRMPETTWKTYQNDRFAIQLSYPSDLFRPMAAPANDDGRTFAGIDGPQRFFVFGQHNIEGLGIKELMTRDILSGGYDSVTYKKAGDGWFLLSGYKGGQIFHRKVLVDQQNEVIRVFQITYPVALKAKFDPVTAKIAASFSSPMTPDSEATDLGSQAQDMQSNSTEVTTDPFATDTSTYRVPLLRELILQRENMQRLK